MLPRAVPYPSRQAQRLGRHVRQRRGSNMPRVFIPPQLRDLTGGQAELEAAGSTVREVIAHLDARFPGLRQRLCEGDVLSPSLQLAIDGQFRRRGLDLKLQPDSELHFLPVFGGG
jgi:molybdopterin converting factor small subunit